MPSVRYSFRRSTVNAGIASQSLSEHHGNERDARRERARARRQASATVSTSSRVLESPPNTVMPIAFQALTHVQLVSGDRPEITATVTTSSAELEVQTPNPLEHGSVSAVASLGVVGYGNQQVSTFVPTLTSASEVPQPTPGVFEAELVATATDPVDAASATRSGIRMKRSSRSPSPLPLGKRRRIERSGSLGEGSPQVAESSAAAIARATSALQRPAVGEDAAGNMDVEMAEATDVGLEPLPSQLASVSFVLGLSGNEAAPREAPASPRALDAAEAMLGLGWVQPVPTPLPSPAGSSPVTSSPPPLPPQQQQSQTPAPSSADDMEAAQAMLGLWTPVSLPVPPSPEAAATEPSSPRALEAAESMAGLSEGSAPLLSPLPQAPSPRALEAAESLVGFAEGTAPLSPPPPSPPSPRMIAGAEDLLGFALPPPVVDEEDEEEAQFAAILLELEQNPPPPPVVTEDVKARRRQYLDAHMPASPYNVGMLAQVAGGSDGCIFCTEMFEEANSNVRILSCNHVFCQPCIDEWLAEQNNNTCPVCRENVFRQA